MNESTATSAAQLPISREASYWRQYGSELVPIVTLYLVLAVYRISDQSLWVDEVISVQAVLSERSMISLFLSSQCPLYFVLLRLWSETVGTSEFALRLFSTVLGALAVCVTYAFGRRLLNRKAAAVAVVFLASSPFFIWYSQEVRYINLMIVTSLLATYCFHQAITTERFGWWALYGVSSLLAAFSFVSVIFLFLAHGLYLIWRKGARTVLLKWMFCQLITAALFAGWFTAQYWERLGPALALEPALSARRLSGDKLQILDVAGTLPYTFFAFSVGFSVGPSVSELHVSRGVSTLIDHAATIIVVAIVFGGLFLTGLRQLSQRRSTGVLLVLWLVVPILATFIATTVTTFAAYNVRYVAMAFPAFLLVLGAGVVSFGRPVQTVVMTVVLVIHAISLSNYYHIPRYAREDARSAARYLESVATPGEVILSVGSATALTYHYRGDLLIEHVNRGDDKSKIIDHLQEVGRRRSRLWLVEIRRWETDPTGAVKSVLDNVAHLGEHRRFPGVEIYSYQTQ